MKKLLFLILFLIPIFLIGQINYTWGYTTAGTSYNQTGYQGADSSTTISIVFDMQDYRFLDFAPTVMGDSTEDLLSNSNRMLLSTFWYRIDAENATDSIGYAIKVYSGNMIYHPNDDSRITTSNINFSTTATTIIDTGTTKAVGDVQWSFVNLYVNSSTDAGSTVRKHLPPEFYKVTFTFQNNAADSMNVYWNNAYPAVIESDQDRRSTIRSDADARKQRETLH